MKTKVLPSSIGSYRIIRSSELSPEQLNVLRRVSRERVTERLCKLIGDGRLSVSQIQAKYPTLMSLVGDA